MSIRKTCFRISVLLAALSLAFVMNGMTAVAAGETKTSTPDTSTVTITPVTGRTSVTGKPPATGGTSIPLPPVTGGTVMPVPPPAPPIVSSWPVSYDDAIKIASAYITPETLKQCKYYANGWGNSAGESHYGWQVVFVAQHLTEADLKYKAAAKEPYQASYLYAQIMITIDGQTGAFISKVASFITYTPAPYPSDKPVITPTPATPPERITGVPAGTGVATPGTAVPATIMPAPWASDMPANNTPYPKADSGVSGSGALQPADGIIPPYAAPDGNSQESPGQPVSARDNASHTGNWWIAAAAGGLIVLVAGGYLTMAHRRAAVKVKPKNEDEIK